jgi:hypothetical protein
MAMRNTSLTGEVCRMQVGAALALQGKVVLLPLGDFQRYDLVFDDNGRFYRVQCKMGRFIDGAIHFYPCSVDSRSQKGTCIRKGYAGEVEYFGVYCPELKKCYLVPVEHAPLTHCCLRLEPPKNAQTTRIRWATNYEMRSEPLPVDDPDLT